MNAVSVVVNFLLKKKVEWLATLEYCQWRFVLPAYVRVLTWFTSWKATKEKSLTANELFKEYLKMSHEDRKQFMAMFRTLFDYQQIADKHDKIVEDGKND
jgi:hypothetical protein